MEVVCSDLFDAQDMTDFFRYCNYMTACFCRKAVSAEWDRDVNLIDHRYFYQFDGSGRCVCGLARDAVAEQLLQWGDKFIDATIPPPSTLKVECDGLAPGEASSNA